MKGVDFARGGDEFCILVNNTHHKRNLHSDFTTSMFDLLNKCLYFSIHVFL